MKLKQQQKKNIYLLLVPEITHILTKLQLFTKSSKDASLFWHRIIGY